MDMGDTMMMGGAPTDGTALNASGIDFSNSTQASMFLGEILDDTAFQVDGNMYARNFWYGVCVVIGICAFFNIVQKATVNMRYVPPLHMLRCHSNLYIECALLHRIDQDLPHPPTFSPSQ